jgi:hypothetical protein
MTMAKCSIVVLHLALAASLAACGAKARAAAVPDGPPLAVPLPPAHEIAVEQIAEAPPQEPPPAPDPVVSIARPSTAAASTPARPESREAQAPAVVAAPTPPAAQPEATAVRASTSAADEKRARDLLAKAAGDLNNRVDYRRLSNEGKAQYDQSKRFSEQALQAMKEKRFDYALTLAEKAADIAAQLVR